MRALLVLSRALLAALVFISTSSLVEHSVYAASMYDNTYNTTSRLVIGDVNYHNINCQLEDITSSYPAILSNQDNWVYSGEYATYWPKYIQGLSSGSVAVSQAREHTIASVGHGYRVEIAVEPDGGEITFTTGSDVRAYGDKLFMIQIYTKEELVGPGGGCTPAIRIGGGGYPISTNPPAEPAITTYKGNFYANYFASGWDINYPPGYEGKAVATSSPTTTYVAMGDSFSSGEGNTPFEYGTNVGGIDENRCHRSSLAYPRLMQNDSALDVGSASFVACSGATTNDVLGVAELDDPSGKWNEPSQIDALSVIDTEIVTISIGGNDVSFSTLAEACFTAPCGPGSVVYSNTMNAITTTLGPKLDSVYRSILTSAPRSEIYVVGYPYITPEDPSDPYCFFLQDSMPGVGVNDSVGARNVVDALNTKISSTIFAIQGDPTADGDRLHFVDPTTTGNEFAGHDVCSTTPYFVYPFAQTASHNWMHPNSAGHVEYKNLVEEAIG